MDCTEHLIPDILTENRTSFHEMIPDLCEIIFEYLLDRDVCFPILLERLPASCTCYYNEKADLIILVYPSIRSPLLTFNKNEIYFYANRHPYSSER